MHGRPTSGLRRSIQQACKGDKRKTHNLKGFRPWPATGCWGLGASAPWSCKVELMQAFAHSHRLFPSDKKRASSGGIETSSSVLASTLALFLAKEKCPLAHATSQLLHIERR